METERIEFCMVEVHSPKHQLGGIGKLVISGLWTAKGILIQK